MNEVITVYEQEKGGYGVEWNQRTGAVRTLPDGEWMQPTPCCPEKFVKELEGLINKHSIENVADVPDFILARMICRMIEAMGPSIKKTFDWHGCNSVCHPQPNS